eukprot:4286803-Pyramimonas_sp.AAC.1
MQKANGNADGAIGTGRAARDTDYTEYQLPNQQCIQHRWRKEAGVPNPCGLAVLLNKGLSGSVPRM